jgi:hypothetical protein
MKHSLAAALLSLFALASQAGTSNSQNTDFLAGAEGEWAGTLIYKEASQPDKRVTQPTMLFVARTAPDEIALHYVFEDGPGKIEHAYERMKFDLAANRVSWLSGPKGENARDYRISARALDGNTYRITLDRGERNDKDEPVRLRYELAFDPHGMNFLHEDAVGGAPLAFRSRYQLERRKK